MEDAVGFNNYNTYVCIIKMLSKMMFSLLFLNKEKGPAPVYFIL